MSIKSLFNTRSNSMSRLENQSPGILDDFAVRKDVATLSGTIEKVPVHEHDIVNKVYVDSTILVLSGANAADHSNFTTNINYISGAVFALSGTNATQHTNLTTNINYVSGAVFALSGANATQHTNLTTNINYISGAVFALSGTNATEHTNLTTNINYVSGAVFSLSGANATQHSSLTTNINYVSGAVFALSGTNATQHSSLTTNINYVSGAVFALSGTNATQHTNLTTNINYVSGAVTSLSGAFYTLSGSNASQHSTFLQLSGGNANQNINIGSYNLSGAGIYATGTISGSKLHIKAGDSGASPNVFYNQMVLENNNFIGISLLTPNDKSASFVWGDPENSSIGGLTYSHASNQFEFTIANNPILQINATNVTGKNLVSNNLLTVSGSNFVVDATGNVGIGTTGPGAQLHIDDSADAHSSDQLRIGQGANYYKIGRNIATGLLDITGTQTGYTGLTINGKVGIGTTAPSNKLDVVGGNIASYNTGGISSIIAGSAATGKTYVGIQTSGDTGGYGILQSIASSGSAYGNTVINPNGGSVGIGTTAPGVALEVKSDLNTASGVSAWDTGGGQLNLRSSAADAADVGPAITFISIGNAGLAGIKAAHESHLNDGYISFLTRSSSAAQYATERMRITSIGNVGIGTTNPDTKLDIREANVPDSSSSGILNLVSTDAVGADLGGKLNFGGSWTGTTYTGWASVAGRKEVATDGNYAGYLSFATRANGAIPAERMRITSAGNVGIGTTAPTETLHISGSANVTGIVSGAIVMCMQNASGALIIKNLKKIDGTTAASNGDSLKWDSASGRVYGG